MPQGTLGSSFSPGWSVRC